MITGNVAAKWFIFHNPEFASGYIDENIKVNELVYFSKLMGLEPIIFFCIIMKITDTFLSARKKSVKKNLMLLLAFSI